ncbi:DUF2845 domain-containing protein [Stigmatella sp. ncwal1]|uniref:DUF2845 domain-containing protein n=1 Tax=Stigmatella ashevillensis TaxID=2995309 RepID=A0ABT5D5E1_9BACT|nr:DUF2845 domain-containing protein [Stigmatella ashevillena]MDC0708881.1 DUF2845 domain-containing protein [Stigmatella ashevillena]
MRSLWMVLPLALFSLPTLGHAASLRCGANLVSDGASRNEVLAKCGEPADKAVRNVAQETKKQTGENESSKEIVYKTFEDWTYNFGTQRLMQVVTFEDGKLIDVQSTRHGH